MFNKGDCTNCGQKVQQSTFDKCMYCGADLPIEQRLTEDERDALIERQKLSSLRESQSRAKNRSESFSGTTSDLIDLGIDFGSDFSNTGE